MLHCSIHCVVCGAFSNQFHRMNYRVTCAFALLIAAPSALIAQRADSASAQLAATITALDRSLFAALNACDVTAFGVHRFFVSTPNGERPGSTAKFIHVWKNDGGTWKIARVLSFDHVQ